MDNLVLERGVLAVVRLFLHHRLWLYLGHGVDWLRGRRLLWRRGPRHPHPLFMLLVFLVHGRLHVVRRAAVISGLGSGVVLRSTVLAGRGVLR